MKPKKNRCPRDRAVLGFHGRPRVLQFEEERRKRKDKKKLGTFL